MEYVQCDSYEEVVAEAGLMVHLGEWTQATANEYIRASGYICTNVQTPEFTVEEIPF